MLCRCSSTYLSLTLSFGRPLQMGIRDRVDALRAVYSLAGENRDVKRIVHEAIAKHGGPEVA